MHRIKHGKNIRFKTIEKACEKLGVDVNDITIRMEEGSCGDEFKFKECDPDIISKLRKNSLKKRKKFQIVGLKQLRKQQKVSKEHIANSVGKSAQMIGVWERGEQAIYEEYVEKIKKVLDIPPEAIIEVTEKNKNLILNHKKLPKINSPTKQRSRTYKYRGYLITPTGNGLWRVHNTYLSQEYKTLSDCKKYIDSKVGEIR